MRLIIDIRCLYVVNKPETKAEEPRRWNMLMLIEDNSIIYTNLAQQQRSLTWYT